MCNRPPLHKAALVHASPEPCRCVTGVVGADPPIPLAAAGTRKGSPVPENNIPGWRAPEAVLRHRGRLHIAPTFQANDCTSPLHLRLAIVHRPDTQSSECTSPRHLRLARVNRPSISAMAYHPDASNPATALHPQVSNRAITNHLCVQSRDCEAPVVHLPFSDHTSGLHTAWPYFGAGKRSGVY